ncbi:MAG: glutamine--fructose-6-phosphate transaminase (isomerizing) [Armatimonadetes bacterium]|nr:glutamine--fructose-6-phosphate transaminase (isomerizing) [Armatimonadota bacterium]MDW8122800.1 glutamine--fructose-6-phosphate transaminase (isomerizing) [Armatimonadota bacterium]
MCGIFAYAGPRDVVEVLLTALKRLQYRGYDSCGIAVLDGDELMVVKEAGPIDRLEKRLTQYTFQARAGIAHTRWATHGQPTTVNAHPHTDCSGTVAVVHNGVIENYRELSQRLTERGHILRSQTDTELIAHLIEEALSEQSRTEDVPNEQVFLQSVRQALSQISGTYAIACLWEGAPGLMIGARHGCPLIVGAGEQEVCLSSDLNAVLPITRKVHILNDDELVLLSEKNLIIVSVTGQELSPRFQVIDWQLVQEDRAGFPTFMLKEIYEQPDRIEEILSQRCRGEQIPFFEELTLRPSELIGFRRIIIEAAGTSWHAGIYGKYLLEKYLRLPTEAEIASEFRYRQPVLEQDTLVIAISQSGETADTLAGLRQAKSRFVRVLGFCNVPGSTLSRESDGTIFLLAGPEVGVASTKAYTAQLIHLFLFTLYLGRLRWILDEDQIRSILSSLSGLPEKMRVVLESHDPIVRDCARRFQNARHFLYLARGINYPTALEGALKLKEISYIHASGYAAGEFKHGPIALVDKDCPVVCIAPTDSVYEKTFSNIEEVRARGGRLIVVTTEGNSDFDQMAEFVFTIPPIFEDLTPLLTVLPLQLLAHHIASLKGLDVDKPRNLAKSVTVE